MMMVKRIAALVALFVMVAGLTACGGGSTGPSLFSLGGTVTGYNSTGLLLASGSMRQPVTAAAGGENVSFRFNQALVSGASYNVTIAQQPQNQTCGISNGVGTISTDVTNIIVTCTGGNNQSGTNYTVGGQITGMITGESVTLFLKNVTTNNTTSQTFSSQSNGGNTPFTFTSQIANSNQYEVSVGSFTGNSRICSRSSAYQGSINSNNVSNVQIVCGTSATLSVNVSGMSGSGLQVAVNGELPQSVSTNGLSNLLQRAANSSYQMQITGQPTGQTCRFANNSSIVSGSLGNGSSQSITCGTGGSVSGDVQPMFAINGLNWNDYVTLSSNVSALNRFQFQRASDVACNVNNSVNSDCLHAGAIRQYDISSVANNSCANITAQDSAQVFQWACSISGAQVRMVSVGFQDNKGLSDLIDWAQFTPVWKNMTLTVRRNGSTLATTTAAKWWSNILSDAANTVSLSNSGTVYYLNQNRDAVYNMPGDKVALVVRPLNTLSGTGTGNNNAVVSITGNYTWLEGVIHANNNLNGVKMEGARYSTLQGVSVEGASSAGVYLKNSSRLNLRTVNSSSNASGIKLDTVHNSRLRAITLNANLYANANDTVNRHGLVVLGSDNNTFSQIRSFNNSGRGIWISNGAKDNRFVDVISANNETGILIDSFNTASGSELSTHQIFQNVTLANGDIFRNGVSLQGSNNTVERIVAINNGNYGISVLGDSNSLVDIASAHNENSAVYIDSQANSMKVEGVAQLAGGCNVVNATDAPLINATCSATNGSTATVNPSASLLNSFVAKRNVSDSTNPSGTQTTTVGGAGTILMSSLNDWEWARFGNDYRGWAPDGNIEVNINGDTRNNNTQQFPAAVHRGPIDGVGNQYILRMWDWSLKLNDSQLRNRFTKLTANASIATATRQHIWSNNQAVRYLVHATEVMDDGQGNDNGLCESFEACYHSPNIGAYQGHGSLNMVNANFSTSGSGGISQVEYMEFQSNGF